MRKAETVAALLLVIGGGAMVRQALYLPVTWTSIGPGAGFFPFWLSVGVLVTAAVLVVQSLRPQPASRGDAAFIPAYAWKPLVVVFAPMVAVIAALDLLGIYFGGAIYLASYMWLVGRFRLLPILLVSVLVPLALFFIFERWFLLPLPKGVILETLLYGR